MECETEKHVKHSGEVADEAAQVLIPASSNASSGRGSVYEVVLLLLQFTHYILGCICDSVPSGSQDWDVFIYISHILPLLAFFFPQASPHPLHKQARAVYHPRPEHLSRDV